MNNYQVTKTKLRSHAEYVKVLYKGDKPAIRQSINDYTDMISKEYDLSEYQRNLLSNYACTLHPKN